MRRATRISISNTVAPPMRSRAKRMLTCLADGYSRPYRLPAWLRSKPERNHAAVWLEAEPRTPGDPLVLEPGLVLLREALGRREQIALAAEAWETGCGHRNPGHSFFEADGSLRGPKGTRGRIFDACSHFSPALTELLLPACADWVKAACVADTAMPQHKASHLLLLYYPHGGTLGFHRDQQANDGTGEEPVVSLSLGSEADFAVRHDHSEVARVFTLRSGDVLLFGGPCRGLLHAVVETRGARSVLPAGAGYGRLSFTLRHAPEVLGHEHLYQDFRPQQCDPRHMSTGDEMLLGAEEAARRLKAMRS
eukprot:gnl/TRDRNA2_/TRDRNA2_63728_c0_seq1.p1 gnl/TRDRNA2_/TRDRNA2_63728_c0~~gnl/TRDRNA2_/TRDRNA2_63728_c0_seq1.p1  ORF type:complete len:308 (-),score=29.59 gnl/TRDRNA2_/TRDRNA2_63728_c0_seq1:58-981(-)